MKRVLMVLGVLFLLALLLRVVPNQVMPGMAERRCHLSGLREKYTPSAVSFAQDSDMQITPASCKWERVCIAYCDQLGPHPRHDEKVLEEVQDEPLCRVVGK